MEANGGRRIFPAGASDNPPEYVDLQIKKFTSVSRARPFQSPERIKISNIFHGYGVAAALAQKFAIIYGAVSTRRNFFATLSDTDNSFLGAEYFTADADCAFHATLCTRAESNPGKIALRSSSETGKKCNRQYRYICTKTSYN